MKAPSNPHQKDAEACTAFIRQNIYQQRRGKKVFTLVDEATLAWIARWAYRWGTLALKKEKGGD